MRRGGSGDECGGREGDGEEGGMREREGDGGVALGGSRQSRVDRVAGGVALVADRTASASPPGALPAHSVRRGGCRTGLPRRGGGDEGGIASG